MVDTVHVRYERELDHPIADAFTWLTDYRNDDPERAGAIVKERRVIEESDDRVVLEAMVSPLGRESRGRAVVHLDPPDHWRADLEDMKGRDAGVYDYRLEPIEGQQDRCRLIVDYHIAAPKLSHKLLLWFTKPLVRRELDDMWDGFAEAMDREIAEDADPVEAPASP